MSQAAPLLQVDRITVEYPGRRGSGPVVAADAVSLEIGRGEVHALVGESGSGKSTVGRAVLGLTRVTAGTIRLSGIDVTAGSRRSRALISRTVQAIFQDPYSCFNPTIKVGHSLAEPLTRGRRPRDPGLLTRVRQMLTRVGLPEEAFDRYPRQFSGGQRQRLAIARALIARPALVVCDEPVSALDLSVQAQILNLLADLREEEGLSYLFIAHNLSVVRHLADRVTVMYRGRVMESGPAGLVCREPAHPYTRALLDAEPVPDPALQRARRQGRLKAGEERPDTSVSTGGCSFAARCAYRIDACTRERPPMRRSHAGADVACLRQGDMNLAGPLSPQQCETTTGGSGS
ncbi:oligopeptide/dipeptide ABC transporter ATP-binding protein [Thermocatellispora tengchongensis]|uniref:Oligopeptide/dipeptide ABC transporter ATP-binding protein n=1 Tax=Thermocatellispora tengchongensis TaxID=1073253 RepID=A0A840PF35_9ACTN|nr:oligopeptide/dipeptide ABC transporter ATP-binding protein [Thermocatellispora tengchongensis]MBB5136070.1 oligopeptide/dipeptide ABC transporter ATP-binding protein [Thermocatellispora tengchongensis]